jgi:DNA polymerase III delta subunit
MITIWIGSDYQKRFEYISLHIQNLRDTLGGIEVLHTDSGVITESFLVHHLSAQQLFGGSKVVVIENAFQKDFFDMVLVHHIKDMHANQTVWIVLGDTLTASQRKKIEKLDLLDCVIEDTTKPVAGQDFTKEVFSFVDACIEKRTKDAWVLYQNLAMQKVGPFELLGALRFGYKSLASVIMYPNKNAVELGLHPYVYGKMKKRAQVYTRKQAIEKHALCVAMFHEYRIEEQLLQAIEQHVLGL